MDNFFDYLPAYLLTGMGIGLIIGFVIQYLFLKNLNDLLKSIREPNRRMASGQVWLVLVGLVHIPLQVVILYASYNGSRTLAIICSVITYLISIFVLIWEIRMVRFIADSIEAEYDSRNIPIEYRPSYQTGMFMVVSNGFTLLRAVPYIAFLGGLAQIAYMIGMISYWIRTYKYKKDIQSLPLHQDEDSLIFKDLY